MSIQLRPYQTRAINDLYDWFNANQDGHPVVAMPGGSGKSVVIAAIMTDAVKNWPGTRAIMLVDSEILVKQNAAALRRYWPNAPIGVYSSGLRKWEMGEPITYAGIQSIWNKADEVGHIDLCLVDEAHGISHRDTGRYRKFLADLLAINPNMRIVGFSASPYRLGHGMIHEGEDALFSDLLEPVSIEELIASGSLVPLRSKLTGHKLGMEGIRKARGEYIEADMARQWNTQDHNLAIVREVIERAQDRKHWLVFCSGVQHSEDMAAMFREHGIPFAAVHSKDKAGGKKALEDFHAGRIRGVASMGQLTTGYDFPALDCIAFARKTMSPGLYLQMSVRGMRPHESKSDCLVLDFVGLVEQHGPITAIQPPKKSGGGNGEPMTKSCEHCWELVHLSAKECPACGEPFPVKEPAEKDFSLRQDDIMGVEPDHMDVTSWHWRKHTSRASGKDMLMVTYYGALSDAPVTEYFPVCHEGYAGQKATRVIAMLVEQSDARLSGDLDLEGWAEALNKGFAPASIAHKQDGKYRRVIDRRWH